MNRLAIFALYNTCKGNLPVLTFCVALLLQACHPEGKLTKNGSFNGFADTSGMNLNGSVPEYRSTTEKKIALIHTRLDLSFDYQQAKVRGKADIQLRPYFYPTDSIILDAVGFNIHELKVTDRKGEKKLKYDYNQKQITIKLSEIIKKTDTLNVHINYTASPNENRLGGSDAIVSDKGLYFINPKGIIPNLPRQIWSQGETQSNSKWFPTIDVPNQKMTQDIYLKVDASDVTLSNGLLIEKKNNGDGTRTDHWKQTLPASPYLTMIAIGNFSVVKDSWNGKEVSYYVEPGYEKYARQIFGKTPEMISYFSDLLQFPFVWEKYSQIAVRGYISGAMENTTATVHSQDIQRTENELLDGDGEDIIAHELFHHWFGDLVTCESWSNLPLNESFATYSEYLWLNHSRGKDEGAYHLYKDLKTYIEESQYKKVNLIRYYYETREDMFDAHSYSKGGLILHYLRNCIGDEAFFTALNLYLRENQFMNVEIEDFRLALEKVTGRDLNWFFDEWFKFPGHPELKIEQAYNDTTHQVELKIAQTQNFNFTPAYQLPFKVDVYHGNQVKSYSYVLKNETQTFYIPVKQKPDLVIFDPQRVIPCERKESKSLDEWAFQLRNGKHFMDRFQAIEEIASFKNDKAYHLLADCATDKFYRIREKTIKEIADNFPRENRAESKVLFKSLARKDEHAAVRAMALTGLDIINPGDDELNEFYITFLSDPSFYVKSIALGNLFRNDPDLGFEYARKFKSDSNYFVVRQLSEIFAIAGSDEENEYYLSKVSGVNNQDKYDFIDAYGKYLIGKNNAIIDKGIKVLELEARENSVWFIKLNALNKLTDINQMYIDREKEFAGKPEKQEELEITRQQKQKITALIDSIRSSETNSYIRELYKN